MAKVRKDRFVSPAGPGVRVLSEEEMALLEDQRRAQKDVEEKEEAQGYK